MADEARFLAKAIILMAVVAFVSYRGAHDLLHAGKRTCEVIAIVCAVVALALVPMRK